MLILHLGQGGSQDGGGPMWLGATLVFGAVCYEAAYTLLGEKAAEGLAPRTEGAIAAGCMGVMPASALILSYMLLGEEFRWLHLLGFGIVLAGVLLIFCDLLGARSHERRDASAYGAGAALRVAAAGGAR